MKLMKTSRMMDWGIRILLLLLLLFSRHYPPPDRLAAEGSRVGRDARPPAIFESQALPAPAQAARLARAHRTGGAAASSAG